MDRTHGCDSRDHGARASIRRRRVAPRWNCSTGAVVGGHSAQPQRRQPHERYHRSVDTAALVGALLGEREGWRSRWTTRPVLVAADEVRLAQWMCDTLEVTWVARPEPATVIDQSNRR